MSAWEITSAKVREIMRQTADAVARALSEQTGSEYRVDTSERYAELIGAYIIDGPEGVRLYVTGDDARGSGNQRATERVRVSGSYPEGSYRKVGRMEGFKISVKRDRGPDVIAREVVRRLLPGYVIELARVVGVIERHDAAKSSQARAVQMLSEATGWHTPTHAQDSVYVGHAQDFYGSARVLHGGDSVSIEMSSVPFDLALKALKVLAGTDD